jgi:hypothetical protein
VSELHGTEPSDDNHQTIPGDQSRHAGGQTIDTEKIGKLIGATEGPARLAEALELGEKMKNARLS